MVIDCKRDPAARCENAIDRGEVVGPVLKADRLDHLDADDGVVGPGDLAVVAQLDVDEIADAGLLWRAVSPKPAARATASPW